MSKYKFVDCQGLAGAWSLATVQTGKFDLIHRASLPGGFGDQTMDDNRAIIGSEWEQEVGPVESWTPQEDVALLCGTPPCSGFSLMNISKGENSRGPDSAINQCMKDLISYAGRCTGPDGKDGPLIVSLESVQGAYKQGRSLMQTLRKNLSDATGQTYDMTHVLMSGSSVGSAQMRHRYYLVLHRIPFGVDDPEPRKVVTYRDAIDDLIGLELQWEDQKLKRKPSDWARPKLRSDGMVGDHQTIAEGPTRLSRVLGDLVEHWEPGETIHQALKRYGKIPPSLKDKWDHEKNDVRGWSWPRRVDPDRPGYVLTGGGVHGFVHYKEDRLFTIRELARLMGYPDEWQWPSGHVNKSSMLIGKCCPVESGRWVSGWFGRALDGDPGQQGEKIGDNEYIHDSTQAYKKWPTEVSHLVDRTKKPVRS